MRRLAKLATGLALGSALVAAPVYAPNVLVPEASAASTCKVRSGKNYCVDASYLRSYTDKAVRWATDNKTSKARKPVPFPNPKGVRARTDDGVHYVYVIYWMPEGFVGPIAPGTKNVWKYGMTGQKDWTKRAKESWRICDKSSTRRCTYDLVAVTKSKNGWYHGRFIEASLVKAWERQYGGWLNLCPPGQPKSCK